MQDHVPKRRQVSVTIDQASVCWKEQSILYCGAAVVAQFVRNGEKKKIKETNAGIAQ